MRWRRLAVGMLVVLVASAMAGLNTDVHAPPRYDGAGYSVLALSLIEGRGYREIDRPDAPRHGHFPPGYPLALASLWWVAWRSVVAAHVFSIVCTIAAVWLAWRWFRRIEPRGVADALGLALAVNWTWGMVGGAIQSEPLYLLLSMLALNAARVRGRWASLGLGGFLGLCVLTRHMGICLVVVVVIDRLISRGGARRDGRDAAMIGLGAVAVLGPWIGWLATIRRNTQVGLLDAQGLLPRVASQALFYARRTPDALTGPFVEVATVFSRSKAAGSVATAGAVVISTIILVGLVRSVRNPRRRLAGLVPLVTMPLLLVWPFTEAGRFLIPLVPYLLVGAAEGLAWCLGALLPAPLLSPEGSSQRSSPLADVDVPASAILLPGPPPTLTLPLKGGGDQKGGRGGDRRGLRWIAARLILLVAVPYPAYALLTHRAEAQRRSHGDFDAACAWIAREARRPGPILTGHPGEVFWQTGRWVVLPASDDLDGLIRQIQDQKIAYILVDADRFANAPPNPLARLVAGRPGAFRRVFEGAVAVDEVRLDSGP